MNIPRANDITHLQLIELNTRKCLFIKQKKSCIIPTYNFIEMPLRPLTTTEESKSSFIISKYILFQSVLEAGSGLIVWFLIKNTNAFHLG